MATRRVLLKTFCSAIVFRTPCAASSCCFDDIARLRSRMMHLSCRIFIIKNNRDTKSQSAAADVALNRKVQGGDFCIASGFPSHGTAQQLCQKRSHRIIIGSGTSRLANTPGKPSITYSMVKDSLMHWDAPVGWTIIWSQVRIKRNLICYQLPREAWRRLRRV